MEYCEGTGMKYVSYSLCDNQATDLILGVSEFSRLGDLDKESYCELLKECKANNRRAIFEWDILMTETVLMDLISLFESYVDSNLVEIVRVADTGALQYLQERHPEIKIQLLLEVGNHNLVGIKAWREIVGEQLDRLVLSSELPKETLREIICELDAPVEILGSGRILLAYSPRKLVSPHFSESSEIMVSSEESPHRDFPVVENRHGTFMFNRRDLDLLDEIEELSAIGIDYLRIDKRFKSSKKTTKGFFSVNKTDILFEKLKNKRIATKSSSYIGDVVENNKGIHLGIMLRNPKLGIKLDDQIIIHSPDGKECTHKVTVLKNSAGEDISSAGFDELVFIRPLRGISIKAMVNLIY